MLILHLYDRALLNRAALRALGIGRDTPDPPGGVIYRNRQGEPSGLLVAEPSALILYSTLARVASDSEGHPQRWKVERTISWMNWNRRLIVDYERTFSSSESRVLIANIAYLLKKI